MLQLFPTPVARDPEALPEIRRTAAVIGWVHDGIGETCPVGREQVACRQDEECARRPCAALVLALLQVGVGGKLQGAVVLQQATAIGLAGPLDVENGTLPVAAGQHQVDGAGQAGAPSKDASPRTSAVASTIPADRR